MEARWGRSSALGPFTAVAMDGTRDRRVQGSDAGESANEPHHGRARHDESAIPHFPAQPAPVKERPKARPPVGSMLQSQQPSQSGPLAGVLRGKT
jgi:hypothetical protein